MKTIVYKIDPEQIDDDRIAAAGGVLVVGGTVAFPTETVYGLGANAFSAEAAAKIYKAKGRPSDNPLIVHIADLQMLDEVAEEIPEVAYRLAGQFWPGPLTMILKKSGRIPPETTGGLGTVAVRMPSHPVALALIRAAGVPVAAPSANTSGRPSPTEASHVLSDLDGRIDMLLDGGRSTVGLESTIVDLTVEPAMILRPGYITKEMLTGILGRVEVDQAILEDNASQHLRPKAPGMKYKHYAPKGDLTIVEGRPEHVIELVNRLTARQESQGKETAVLAARESAAAYHCKRIYCLGSRTEEETIAANLYDILRKLDDDGVEVIYSESCEETGLGQAIMNRLLKAAGHQVIDADAWLSGSVKE